MAIKLQHLRSSVAGKAPQAADLDVGQIAVNFNDSDPALYIKDSAGSVVRIAGGGAAGDLWDRSGTELTPKNAGDDVFTSGDVKVGGTTAAPNITVKSDGGIVANTDGLVYDGTNKRLAIRTTNPAGGATLDARGDVRVGNQGSGDGTTGVVATKGLYIGTNDSTTTTTVVPLQIGAYPAAPGYSGTPDHAIVLDGWSGGAVYHNAIINRKGRNLSFHTAITGNSFSDTNERVRIDNLGNFLLGGTLPASPNITLGASGSGAFAGPVESTGGDTTNNSLIQLGTGTSNKAGIKLFTDKTLPGSTGITAQINASDGSATFAGDIKHPTFNLSTQAGLGCSVQPNGVINIQRPNTATSTDYILRCWKGTGTVASIAADGTTLIGGTLPASPNIELKADGTATVKRCDAKGAAVTDTAFFANVGAGAQGLRILCSGETNIGWDVGGSKPNTSLKADGSATFNGNLNILGAVSRVYADNTAAKAGGLVDGDVYRKADGTLMIVYT